jgi:hypothetical protein
MRSKMHLVLQVIIVIILSYTSCIAQVSTSNGIISSSNIFKTVELQGYWTLGELIVDQIPNAQISLVNGLAESNAVFVITGDISEPLDEHIQVYPIPFQSHFFIENELEDLKQYPIDFTDETRKKLEFQINFVSDRKAKVEVRDLPTGLYILTITTKSSIKTFKLIKQ